MRRTHLFFALVLSAVPAWGQTGRYVDTFQPPPIYRMPTVPSPQIPSPQSVLTDRPPVPIGQPMPAYSDAYAEKGIQGTVVVEFIVRTDGTVADAFAVQAPDRRLAQAAVAAVSQWTFEPGIKNGMAVNSRMRVPIVFAPGAAGNDPQAEAIRLQIKGESALQAGDDIAAMSAFDAALRLAPEVPDTTYDRGLARAGLGEFRAALADFSEAIRLDPDDERYHAARGSIEARLNDETAALADFESVASLSSDLPAGYDGRGAAYAALGRDDEALEDFRQALTLDPGDAAAIQGMAGVEKRRRGWDAKARAWEELRYRTFQTVWQTVDERYFDPNFGGIDWPAVREKYRLLLPKAKDNEILRELLYHMLAELGKTHFAIIPREGAVFNPAERVRIGTAGAEVAWVKGAVTVVDVKAGSAAAAAGLAPGDRVTGIGNVVLSSTMAALRKAGLSEARRNLYLVEFVQSSLEGPVGSRVILGLAGPPGASRTATVTCRTNDAAWSEPVGHFPSLPMHWEFSRSPDGIAYARFNTFALPALKAVRSFVATLKPGDGLVLDLRGNGGGVVEIAAGLAGWLSDKEFVLGTAHSRGGPVPFTVYPQHGAFVGPLAILIDGRSASASEILAAGLEQTGRARLFGERSAGAALPSEFTTLPTGDLFQYAVGDIVTPGNTVIEGVGVAPDETVAPNPADFAAGRDPALDAARKWLAAERARK